MIGRLHDRIFFSMRTETLVQCCPRYGEIITTWATAFIAVASATGCTVIARRNDSLVLHNDGGYFSLHTIGTRRNDFRDVHEVFIPARPLDIFQEPWQQL